MRVKLMGEPESRGTSWAPRACLTAAEGITVDCQIVCCPGYNDREQLSFHAELAELHPRRRQRLHSPVGPRSTGRSSQSSRPSTGTAPRRR